MSVTCPWIPFHFNWVVYPAGELPDIVFLKMFFHELHRHPLVSPGCHVMCPDFRTPLAAGDLAGTVQRTGAHMAVSLRGCLLCWLLCQHLGTITNTLKGGTDACPEGQSWPDQDMEEVPAGCSSFQQHLPLSPAVCLGSCGGNDMNNEDKERDMGNVVVMGDRVQGKVKESAILKPSP